MQLMEAAADVARLRMTSAIRALEDISSSLVRTRDNPVGLLASVVRAVAGHMHADWTMVALRPSALPGFDIRFLACGSSYELVDCEEGLPPALRAELHRVHEVHDPAPYIRDGWAQVPITLGGEVFGLLVSSRISNDDVEPEDLSVLRIFANQAAMSIQTAALLSRTAALERAEGRLQVLHQRELLDAERHRIAVELHDCVAQFVLSAGLAVDVCRADSAEHDGVDDPQTQRLTHARDLVARAGEQVRAAIYALDHRPAGDEIASLSDLLRGLAAQHLPTLGVSVRVDGVPVSLDTQVEHALVRVAGEALFNASIHANATQATVRLRYRPDTVAVWVSDDGTGDPRELRRRLRSSRAGTVDGHHQGLVNMARRARDLGGTFAIRRAGTGGIRIEFTVPTPVAPDPVEVHA